MAAVIRPGFALLFAILLSLLLSGVALGMVATGTREAVIAEAAARRARARALAEGHARAAMRDWSTRAVADLGPGDDRVVFTGGDGAVFIERVDRTLYLIRAEARVPPGGVAAAVARAGMLVRVLDPERTARSFPAAVTVDGPALVTGGLIDGRDACGGEDGPGVLAPSIAAHPDAVLLGSPAVVLGTAPAPPEPDPLAPPIVTVLATIQPIGGTISPRPLGQSGSCEEDSRNWGAPEAGHACYPLLPLVHAPHDLSISGGRARAVIVVDGDLTVDAGARLAGLVRVRGTLTVEGGASIRGAVRAGSLALHDGAVRADRCVVGDAVSAPALDGGFRPARRWWVPVF